MIDAILIAVVLAVFYGGFKVGNSFKTITEMLEHGIQHFK